MSGFNLPHTSPVNALCFNHSSTRFASGDDGGFLFVHTIDENETFEECFKAQLDANVTCLAWSSDDWLVVCLGNGSVFLFLEDFDSGEWSKQLIQRYDCTVNDIAFASEGVHGEHVFVLALQDGNIVVYSEKPHQERQFDTISFKAHPSSHNGALCVSFHSHLLKFASGGSDCTIKVWRYCHQGIDEREGWFCEHEFENKCGILCLAWKPSLGFPNILELMSGDMNGNVMCNFGMSGTTKYNNVALNEKDLSSTDIVWNTEVVGTHTAPVHALQWNLSGTLLGACFGKEVAYYGFEGGEWIKLSIEGSQATVTHQPMHPQERKLEISHNNEGSQASSHHSNFGSHHGSSHHSYHGSHHSLDMRSRSAQHIETEF
ncbi:hypothetical protein PCE1_000907 [Barthelona sp. PCE]